jgi:PPOX class probable F420-dependent enzyme
MSISVDAAPVARLATVTATGRAHVVPVCFAMVGDVVYTAVDHKPKRTSHLARIANVLATGTASILVDHYSDDWSTLWWVRLDGTGRLVDDPSERARAIVALTAKYPQYAAKPPAGPVLAIDVHHRAQWSYR